MDFIFRKTAPPDFPKEALDDADTISRGLDYDDDIGIVKYVDGKKIGVFFIPFSLYLALRRHNAPMRIAGVVGVVQKGERYIITKQAKRAVEAKGVGKLIDMPARKGLSFQGFAMEWENDPMEAVYAELVEELGLEKDDVTEMKRDVVIDDKEVLFAVLFRTELEESVMRNLKSVATDGWEIEELMLMGKQEAREYLKDSGLLAVFNRLVGK
jgi:hypothetical protein